MNVLLLGADSVVRFHVRYECGHIVSVSLEENVSPTAFRYQSLFQSPRICSTCIQVSSQREKKPKLRQGVGLHALRALSGSAYQVAWAMDIRALHMQEFLTLIHGYASDQKNLMIAEMVRLVNQQSDARFWIEHHKNTFAPFVSVCNALIRSIVIDEAFVQQSKSSDSRLPGSEDEVSVGWG